MKRKIFTFVSTLALSAALIVSAQAAPPDCTLQNSTKSCPSPIFLPGGILSGRILSEHARHAGASGASGASGAAGYARTPGHAGYA